MAFFSEKVRRIVPGNFTFLVMTDRDDLDDQIWRTFIGCGVADDKTPRAGSGRELLYSERDDIIVISDEAHRTQAGKFARNMRLALPNASFIGFTGTPLFKHDQLIYIDKPMRAHNLMQAIARANRVFPGKDCGVIVDYNGMLKSLREALAQYAMGDDDNAAGGEIVAPIEELVVALLEAIEEAEKHLLGLGFDCTKLHGAKGLDRIEALRDARDALYTSDEAKRRYEIMARQVFMRFKTLLMEPSALAYAERHDNIEAICKKLEDRRDTADVTEVLKELHRIINEAIRTALTGGDQGEGLTVDLSKIDFEKLRKEFATKVRRKHSALKDIRDVVEQKLAQMLARNPLRMDYYKKYQEIIADYNREKDRATVEATFAQLVELAAGLDAEQRRAAEEGLSDNELALFDLLFKESISKAERERLKQGSQALLAALTDLLRPMKDWTQKAATQAEVRVFILDKLYGVLPRPPFTETETEDIALRVYDFVWQQSASGRNLEAA